jgi:hypothetical protein
MLAAAYLSLFAYRGWIPHDEGLLAHSAERVLQGQLPHRDFDEVYSGGLSWLHALAFALLGERLTSMRIVLFAFALAYVPVLFFIAARFASPLTAGMVVILCLVWSLPNYFAGLPSWYVLFFSTFGLHALLRHLDTGRRRWLFLAGVWGGLAVLVKSAGVFYAAGALLALVHAEQAGSAGGPRSLAFALAKSIGLGVLVAALWALVRGHGGAAEIVHFVVPAGAVCAFLSWSEWRHGGGPLARRCVELGRLLAPFVAGFAVPIALFLLAYRSVDALQALWQGVFFLPQRRLSGAFHALPPLWTAVAALPYAALLASRGHWSKRAEMWTFRALAALSALLLASAGQPSVYRAVWYSVRPLVPLAVVIGCVFLASRSASEGVTRKRRLEVFLLLSATALLSLLQYPFSREIYFCYTAPPLVLAIASLVCSHAGAPRGAHLCVAWFYLGFGIAYLNTGNILSMGSLPGSPPERSVLDLERGGLHVRRSEARLYTRVVREVRAHSKPDSSIYAAPDCPEVYFLAQRQNPTRTMYDLFDRDFGSAGRTGRILDALEANRVDVIVANWRPEFSPRIDPDLWRELKRRYPNEARMAPFVVRWRG